MSGFLNSQLSKRTSIFGLKLWVVLSAGVGAIFVLIFIILSVCLAFRRSSRKMKDTLPQTKSKEIREARVGGSRHPCLPHPVYSISSSEISGERVPKKAVSHLGSLHADAQSRFMSHNDYKSQERAALMPQIRAGPKGRRFCASDSQEIHEEGDSNMPGKASAVKGRQGLRSPSLEKPELMTIALDQLERVPFSRLERGWVKESLHGSADSVSTESSLSIVPEAYHLGWGNPYTLGELSVATESFAECNVVGEGGYGIVYKGQIGGITVAVKNLQNNRGQAEKEFRVEVEAIGRVRHKNLVRLLGYCAEGNYRMLVYEYVDNGNLEQWLHGPKSKTTSLPWDKRTKIILGTAKAIAYLHEALEPKVVHRDIKASNILIDSEFNAKVSDFGLAKLLGSDKSHVTTRVMGTFGYVAPEYASTGMLTEKSDVYSFGVLLMEVVSGRDPVDYSRPSGEVNLVDWVKMMVSDKRSEDVVDPNLELKPPLRTLKGALLISLRCVDPDSSKRPAIGHVVHMLEADEFKFHDNRRVAKEIELAKKKASNSQKKMVQDLSKEVDDDDSDLIENLSPRKAYKKQWMKYAG